MHERERERKEGEEEMERRGGNVTFSSPSLPPFCLAFFQSLSSPFSRDVDDDSDALPEKMTL